MACTVAQGLEGEPVCERLHCIDSNPGPRLFPNQWRIEMLDPALGARSF